MRGGTPPAGGACLRHRRDRLIATATVAGRRRARTSGRGERSAAASAITLGTPGGLAPSSRRSAAGSSSSRRGSASAHGGGLGPGPLGPARPRRLLRRPRREQRPKLKSTSRTVATPGTAQIGPAAVAQCRSGSAVSGGFSTPPPFTATGAATRRSPTPTRKAWQAQVLSNQTSSVTSYVYCAKRKQGPVSRLLADESSSTATLDLQGDCQHRQPHLSSQAAQAVHPRRGRVRGTGRDAIEYLVPTDSNSRSADGINADAVKAGSGTPPSSRRSAA